MAKAVSKARAIGRSVFGGRNLIGSGISLGVGALSAGASSFIAEKSADMRKRWWAIPLALAVGGHLVKGKSQNIGGSMLGAAGAVGYFNKRLSDASAAAGGGEVETTGVQEVGAVDDYVGLLQSMPETQGIQDVAARPARTVMGMSATG